ncbi:MAG: hypothetical protein AABZ55_01635, partial [Bdellovibrionota bacterium]
AVSGNNEIILDSNLSWLSGVCWIVALRSVTWSNHSPSKDTLIVAFKYSAPVARQTPRGQLKCFQCRKAFPSKEGDWLNWKNMQVFLCKICDRATQGRPERK